MTGEVIDREPYNLEPTLQNLGRALDMAVDSMRHVTSRADDAYKLVPEDLSADVTHLAEKLNGALVEVASEGTRYFAETKQEGVLAVGRLAVHRHQRTDAKGIWRGLEEVRIARTMGSGMEIHQCFALDPLYRAFDRNIISYYANRDRLEEITHPFGLKEFANTRLYIPVFDYFRGSLKQYELPVPPRIAE
jgi:hypothetical protein